MFVTSSDVKKWTLDRTVLDLRLETDIIMC